MFDSVLTRFTETPFAEDRPLIPRREIIRVMDAIEEVAIASQMKILEDETEQLLREATPYLENPNLEKIAALDWNAGVKLQRPIVEVWGDGWEAGGEQLLAEARAAIPSDALKEVESSFSLFSFSSYALPSDVLTALRILLRLRPGTLTNTAAEQAVLRRAIQLAGNFSRDQLGRLKVHLISAISPDIQGVIIDRRELLNRIENTLGVGRVRSEMICRTELTGAYNTARVQTASQSALVSHLRFLAINDDRVTDICQSRNGILLPIEEVEAIALNKPPLHVQCRSTLSPVMPRVSPLHAQWVADPARDYRNRSLVALPDGWNGITPSPSSPPAPTPAIAEFEFPSREAFGDAELTPLREGLETKNAATIFKTTIDGQQYFVKGLGNEKAAQNEQMAYEIGQILEIQEVIPVKTYQFGGTYYQVSPLIEGQDLLSAAGDDYDRMYRMLDELPVNTARDLLGFDILLANNDRHEGNVFVESSGKIRLIDHELSMYSTNDRIRFNLFQSWGSEESEEELGDRYGATEDFKRRLRDKLPQIIEAVRSFGRDPKFLKRRATQLLEAEIYNDLPEADFSKEPLNSELAELFSSE